MLPREGNGGVSDLNALGAPAPPRPEKQETPKRTHAGRITDEMIKISERELNILIEAAVEKIAHTRNLIVKLDGLLTKRL